MLFPDGVIVINKPAGPTSHDIVAVMRRALRRSPIADGRSTMKVGHTGTLDPLASGVLPLVLGKATRLAQFLTSAEKEYEADVELGVSTTTLDRGGEVVERERTREVAALTRDMIDEAVAELVRQCGGSGSGFGRRKRRAGHGAVPSLVLGGGGNTGLRKSASSIL